MALTVLRFAERNKSRVLASDSPQVRMAHNSGTRSLATSGSDTSASHGWKNHCERNRPQKCVRSDPDCSCRDEDVIHLFVGKIETPLYCNRNLRQHSKSAWTGGGIGTEVNGDGRPCINEYRRLLKALPAITTDEAKFNWPANTWMSLFEIEFADRPCSRVEIYLSILSCGSLTLISTEFNSKPTKSSTWEGPLVFSGAMGIPMS